MTTQQLPQAPQHLASPAPAAAPSAMAIEPLLRALVTFKGSDLHFKAGSIPKIRVDGVLTPLDHAPVTQEVAEAWVTQTMTPKVAAHYAATNEGDYAVTIPSLGRFRVNAFRALGNPGLIARRVIETPPTFAQLGLPPIVQKLAQTRRGMILVTGPTGSGKTNTLGAMVDEINRTWASHILTIEDPVEIIHTDKRASMTQREVGIDTDSFNIGLRAAMREDPDVIQVGEMRDLETMSAGLTAAETGHLLVTTLHTTDATETINRVLDFYPLSAQHQVRAQLAQSLKGIICQRLVPSVDGGRVCVMEVLVATVRIQEAIADPDKTGTLSDIIAEGSRHGMQTFDQHLTQLVVAGRVSISDAKKSASHPHDFSVMLKRAGLDPETVDAA